MLKITMNILNFFFNGREAWFVFLSCHKDLTRGVSRYGLAIYIKKKVS
jgi:hypothetical protein